MADDGELSNQNYKYYFSPQFISNLSNWKEKPAWKNQGFNEIRDLRDTGAMLYQLSDKATHWERDQFIEFISSVKWCEVHMK